MKNGASKTPNLDLVLDWLCQSFKVKDKKEINPWVAFPVASFEPAREVFITTHCGSQNLRNDILVIDNKKSAEEQKLVCKLGDAEKTSIDHAPTSLLPRKPFCNPVNGQPLRPNLEKVAVFSVVVRHAINTVPRQIGLRLNFKHQALDDAQKTSEREEFQHIMGAPKGVFYNIPPSTPLEGIDVRSFGLKTLDHHYANIEFIRSMAYVTKDNVMNGILHLPRDLCISAGLDVYQGPPPPPNGVPVKDTEAYEKAYLEQYRKNHNMDPPHHWVAIPYNHVLSWGWHLDPITRKDVFSYDIVDVGIQGKGRLYYLVQNNWFEKKYASFERHFLDKVAFFDLKEIGVEFIPILNVPSAKQGSHIVNGVTQATGHFGYMTFPHMTPSIVKQLAPCMSPNFPAFGQGRAALVLAQKKYF